MLHSICKGEIVQNPTGKVPVSQPVRLSASEDARRLALILFQNFTLSPGKAFLKNNHLRQPAFYKDILELDKPPGNRKCTQIYDAFKIIAFKIIETDARNF